MLTLSAAGCGGRQASHVHVDDEIDEGDEARIAVGEAPVGGVAQLLVGRTVVVGGPGGAHDVHEVAVGDSEHVLEGSDVPLGFDVERELLAGAHHAVAEQVAVVLGRAVVVADDGQLLVDHHAQTSEQRNLSAGQADAAGTPDAASSVGGVGDVGVGQHAGGFQPGSHVGVDGDGVNSVGALTQQVLRSSDGGR